MPALAPIRAFILSFHAEIADPLIAERRFLCALYEGVFT